MEDQLLSSGMIPLFLLALEIKVCFSSVRTFKQGSKVKAQASCALNDLHDGSGSVQTLSSELNEVEGTDYQISSDLLDVLFCLSAFLFSSEGLIRP